MSKKILMLSGYSVGFKVAWGQYGYDVVEMRESIIDYEKKQLESKLLDIMESELIGYVFSFDFAPKVAELCQKYGIVYISWVFDSPHSSLWNRAAFYETNQIFIFDYALWKEVVELGIENVYYLPLSTDVGEFQRVIREDANRSADKYRVDVSFMGNLYDKEPHNYFDQIRYLPPYVRGYLEGVIEAQRRIWGSNIVRNSMTDYVWRQIKENVRLELENEYADKVYESFIEGIIHEKVTQLERKEMCAHLARNFEFALYTGGDTSFEPAIDNRGYLDYIKQMPLNFYYSKININITLHSIETGIPLRLLDILACGGFVLTNYQEEIATYFEDGVELVIYRDFDDLYEKIAYYLEHEEERKAIARAGYEKVKNQFDYIHGVGKIVSVLEGEAE